MKGDKITAKLLSVQEIPKADKDMIKALSVPEGYISLGIVTADIDDVAYTAIDEATKKQMLSLFMLNQCMPDQGMRQRALQESLLGYWQDQIQQKLEAVLGDS